MRVMVIVKASEDSEAGVMPSEELLTEMGKFNEELASAGILLAGEGLHPSSKGVRVEFTGRQRVVTDGPFAETKELIAGYWIWNVQSMQEAIAWVQRCPNPHEENGVIEIRPIFEADDFGETFTPQLREQEAKVRAQALGLEPPRFEDGRELCIAGIKETYTLETRANIPAQWEKFAPMIGTIPGQVGMTSYGVCWNQQAQCDFDYLAGVEVRDTNVLSAEFTHLVVPAGRYTIFTHREHVSAIPRTIDTIWTKWVPDCGLKVAQTPCFERYTEDFDPRTGMGGMEIWIPIEA